MALQIPARIVAEVREQGVNAGDGFGRDVEIVFGLLILEANRVIRPDLDRSVRIPGLGDGEANAQKIACVDHGNGEQQIKEDAFECTHVSLRL